MRQMIVFCTFNLGRVPTGYLLCQPCEFDFELYLIGQKNVGRKWRNFSEVTKILSDEELWPTKILSDIFLSNKVFTLTISLTDL